MLICYDRATGIGCGAENPDGVIRCINCGRAWQLPVRLFNPGDVVARYKIVKLIGSGGFGAVYHAEELGTAKKVALKENFDLNSAKEVQDEFKVMATLEHANLPTYLEAFHERGNSFLVMELIEGKSLEEVLRQANPPLTESQVIGYAMQVCDALTYLHSQNPPIIHRDIKPANIRITSTGLIKLVDFGLLKQGTASTQTRSLRRGFSEFYSPIEQTSQSGTRTDARSDIYALGATLYHLLAGKPPLPASERFAQQTDVLPPLHQVNPKISITVSNAVAKAMARWQNERFATVEEMRCALKGVRIPTPQAQPKATPSPQAPIMRRVKCGFCGNLNRANAKFCATCGKSMAVPSLPPLPPPPAPKIKHAPVTPPATLHKSTAAPSPVSLPPQAISPPAPLTSSSRSSSLGWLRVALFIGMCVTLYWGLLEFQKSRINTLVATPTPRVTPPPPGALILSDTFDSNANQWAVGEYTDERVVGKRSIANGKLQWDASARDGFSWLNLPAMPGVNEIQAAVDVQQMSGTSTANYGLVFRYVDKSNYNLFQIAGNTFSLLAMSNGRWQTIIPPTPSSAIRVSKMNRLGVLVQAGHMTMFVNGEPVSDRDTTTLNAGKVGLMIGLDDAGDQAVFEFDNFEVRMPGGTPVAGLFTTPTSTNTPMPTTRAPATPVNTPVPTARATRSVIATAVPTAAPALVKLTNAAANWSPNMGNGNWYYVEGNLGDYAHWQDMRFDSRLSYQFCAGGCWRSNMEADFVRLDQYGGHPGQWHYVGKRWVSPLAARLRVSVVTRMVAPGGNGVTVRIIQNGNVLQTIEVDSDQTQDMVTTFDASITVKGWLMMAVEANGNTDNDHCVFDMTIWQIP